MEANIDQTKSQNIPDCGSTENLHFFQKDKISKTLRLVVKFCITIHINCNGQPLNSMRCDGSILDIGSISILILQRYMFFFFKCCQNFSKTI